jgi:hypothetical protein
MITRSVSLVGSLRALDSTLLRVHGGEVPYKNGFERPIVTPNFPETQSGFGIFIAAFIPAPGHPPVKQGAYCI